MVRLLSRVAVMDSLPVPALKVAVLSGPFATVADCQLEVVLQSPLAVEIHVPSALGPPPTTNEPAPVAVK